MAASTAASTRSEKNIRNVQKLNERELELGVIGKKSWHDEYKDSAWLFLGGLPYDLSEGDIICVFSQYGEVVNFNLVRDHKTGKSKGFAFLCYEDQRSTVLSVDNLNGIKILGRTIRVDHVKEYKIPKEHKNDDDIVVKMREDGCAPKIQESSESQEEEEEEEEKPKVKQKKKDKLKLKKEKKKKKKKKESSSSSGSESESEQKDTKTDFIKEEIEIKQERHDAGYDNAFKNSRSQGGREGSSGDAREERQGGRNRDKGRLKDASYSGSDVSSSRNSRDRRKSPGSPSSNDRGESDRRGYGGSEKEGRRDRERREDHPREDRERDRDRYRDQERDRQRDRDVDRHREKYRDRSADRHRDRDRIPDRGQGRQIGSFSGRDRGRDDDRERRKDRSRSR